MPFLFKVYNEPEGPEFPPPIPWLETFTGENGSEPDPIYWNYSANGTNVINNNKLRMISTHADGTWSALNFQLSGDFTVAVEWTIQGVAPSNGTAPAGLEIRIDASNRIWMLKQSAPESQQIWMSSWASNVRVDNKVSATGVYSGKFRVRRVGNTWYGDYDKGAGWATAASRNIGFGDTTLIRLINSNWVTTPILWADYDNFTISQGAPIG